MGKKVFCFLLAALATVISPGCRKSPDPLPTIRVGHAPHDHHSPLYVTALEIRSDGEMLWHLFSNLLMTGRDTFGGKGRD